VALDSNVVIYFIEQHETFRDAVRPIFEAISSGRITAVVSVITLLEVLVEPLRGGRSEVVASYRQHLLASANLSLIDVDPQVAETAAQVRSEHNLRVADALVAATALTSGCTHLVANDRVFTRIPELKTLVVSDFIAQ